MKPWLKMNHHISVKRNPDDSALICTSVWFPRMAGEKIQHKHVKTCFPRRRKKKKKKVAAAYSSTRRSELGNASSFSSLKSHCTCLVREKPAKC